MWDPVQKWDGTNDRPSALLSVPQLVCMDKNNHLIGLFCRRFRVGRRDHLQASKPYQMTAGKRLTLKFSIITSSNADALTPARFWYRRAGLPAAGLSGRPYKEEIKAWGIPTDYPTVNIADYEHTQSVVRESPRIASDAVAWVKEQREDGSWVFDWTRDPVPSFSLDFFGECRTAESG